MTRLKGLNEAVTLAGHSGAVYHLAKLNHRKFVTCSQDKTIKFWDLKEMRCITTMDVGEFVSALCVVPKTLLIGIIGDRSNRIYFWDARQEFQDQTVDLLKTARSPSPISCIHPCKAKGYKYFATGDLAGSVHLWDAFQAKLLVTMKLHSKRVS